MPLCWSEFLLWSGCRTQRSPISGSSATDQLILCGLKTWTLSLMTTRCSALQTVRGSSSRLTSTCCSRFRIWPLPHQPLSAGQLTFSFIWTLCLFFLILVGRFLSLTYGNRSTTVHTNCATYSNFYVPVFDKFHSNNNENYADKMIIILVYLRGCVALFQLLQLNLLAWTFICWFYRI